MSVAAAGPRGVGGRSNVTAYERCLALVEPDSSYVLLAMKVDFLVELACRNVVGDQRLEPRPQALTDGIVQPALVAHGRVPFGDDQHGVAVDQRAQESSAEEAAAPLRVAEHVQLLEGLRELGGRARPHRQPQDRDDRHALRLRAQASSETAAAKITPLITYCHCVEVPSRLKPLPIICRKKAPSTARQIAPSPPSSETPQRTIAVITSKSIPRLAPHCGLGFDVLTAIVLGGVSLLGGEGAIWRAV